MTLRPARAPRELEASSGACADATSPSKKRAPPTTELGALHIEGVRLEPADPLNGKPSAMVRFDLVNQADTAFDDIIVEVCINRARANGEPAVTTLLGPLAVRGRFVVEPGDTVRYEMRVRNISSDCHCSVTARVLTARSVTSPGRTLSR